MTKTKLTILALAILVSTTSIFANPIATSKCCQPRPVGGMQVLAENTIYPLLAERDHIESNVVLTFHIDIKGNVTNTVVTQSGGSVFDQSAIDAVMNTQWSPAMQDGGAVPVTFALPFEYRSR